nr:hypothetical protein [Tanacetum cinerariifolium]
DAVDDAVDDAVGTLKLVKQIVDSWKRIMITDGDLV